MPHKDFNGTDLIVGDTIFFSHKMSQQIIAKISDMTGQKTLVIKSTDIVKCSKSLQDHIKSCIKANVNIIDYDPTFCVYCNRVIKM